MKHLTCLALSLLLIGSDVDAAVKTQPILISTLQSITSYSVGNSLTQGYFVDNGRLTALAATVGATWVTKYHIKTSEDLTFIVANPSTFNEVAPSQWNTALPVNAYDTLIFEPFPIAPGTPSTIQSELTSFRTLVTSAQSGPSVNPNYFIYETWPQTTKFNPTYNSYWAASFTPTTSSQFSQQKATTQLFYQQMQLTLGANVYVIPAGAVFNEIDIEARAGLIPGISSIADLYGDATHMGGAGQFVTVCTVYSTVLRMPVNAPDSILNAYRGGTNVGPFLTDAMATQFEAIVWSVVSTDPRAIH